MKIISKFKDYYDFAAGYDTDPRKVYVRERIVIERPVFKDRYEMLWSKNEMVKIYNQLDKYTCKHPDKPYFKGMVAFCDEYYHYLHDIKNNQFYYDYNKIPEEITKDFYHLDNSRRVVDLKYLFRIKKTEQDYWWLKQDKLIKNPNKLINYPVMFTSVRDGLVEETLINGCLADIKFGMVKSPQQAYQELYNWIEFKEPQTDSSPTNMDRFESKGFDKKSSFRNINKKIY